jgi:hypothetical protein
MEKITEKACEHRKDVEEKKDSNVKWWMGLQKRRNLFVNQ